MQLGAFSVGLAVRDIAVSRAFYEKLGFKAFAGEQSEGPASLVTVDPDGNQILVDQHV